MSVYTRIELQPWNKVDARCSGLLEDPLVWPGWWKTRIHLVFDRITLALIR